jgi:hypothetical protein
MEVIQDYNGDGKINWKDFLFYGITITGNIIFTILNIVK